MIFHNINFKLLRTFQLVAEHRSFRVAADLSHRSASAMTMQIRELEVQLGVTLFHRTSRTVQLTPEGEHLLLGVRRASEELGSALQQIRSAVDLQRGHVSIASIPTIAQVALPTAIVEFHERHPSITVHLRELMTSELLESLRRGDVELGIGAWVKNRTEFTFHRILDDPICVALPAAHPLAASASVTFAEVNALPLLTLAPSTALRMFLDDYFQERGLQLTPCYESRQAATMIAMSSAGLGAALLTRTSIANFATQRVKVIPLSDAGLSLPICLITLRGHALTPPAQRLADIIEQHLKSPPSAAESPAQRAPSTG